MLFKASSNGFIGRFWRCHVCYTLGKWFSPIITVPNVMSIMGKIFDLCTLVENESAKLYMYTYKESVQINICILYMYIYNINSCKGHRRQQQPFRNVAHAAAFTRRWLFVSPINSGFCECETYSNHPHLPSFHGYALSIPRKIIIIKKIETSNNKQKKTKGMAKVEPGRSLDVAKDVLSHACVHPISKGGLWKCTMVLLRLKPSPFKFQLCVSVCLCRSTSLEQWKLPHFYHYQAGYARSSESPIIAKNETRGKGDRDKWQRRQQQTIMNWKGLHSDNDDYVSVFELSFTCGTFVFSVSNKHDQIA